MVNLKKDLLELFELKENFSEDELKKSYKRLVKIAHPDTGGDANLFKFIKKAKDLLLSGDKIEFDDSINSKNEFEMKKENSKRTHIKFESLCKLYSQYRIKEYEADTIYEIISVKFKNLFGINEKSINLNLTTPYSQFEINRFVEFTSDIIIPKEFKNSLILNVNVSILDKKYNFIILNIFKITKVIEYNMFGSFDSLKLILNLTFKK